MTPSDRIALLAIGVTILAALGAATWKILRSLWDLATRLSAQDMVLAELRGAHAELKSVPVAMATLTANFTAHAASDAVSFSELHRNIRSLSTTH